MKQLLFILLAFSACTPTDKCDGYKSDIVGKKWKAETGTLVRSFKLENDGVFYADVQNFPDSLAAVGSYEMGEGCTFQTTNPSGNVFNNSIVSMENDRLVIRWGAIEQTYFED
jgi:hypothetical protein